MALKRTVFLDNWDPLEAAYNSTFNTYDSGPGANLNRSLQLPRRAAYTDGSNVEYYSLYISGISPQITDDGLKNIFSNFGQPCSVKIMQGKPGTKTNFGFVSFSTLREAQVAISEIHKKPPHFLNVSFAKSSERGKAIQERGESICYSNELQLPNNSLIDSLPLDPEGLMDARELEDILGCELDSYGDHYCNKYDYEIPSVAKLHWTCNRDGQKVVIGRGSYQKYGSRYSLPDISEDRRQRIEAIIKEKVYYNRRKNGIYEYSEEETHGSIIGPCNYCNEMTYMVCEQCSATLYCSTYCQIEDYPHHKRFCISGKNLRISKQGEKRSVAVKLETDLSANSKSHEKFKGQEKCNASSHDKKCDISSTELVNICNKPNKADNMNRETCESSREIDKHVMNTEKNTDMQVHNKSSGMRDNFQSRRGNIDSNNTIHRYNRTDKAFKSNHANSRRESSNDKSIVANSRNDQKVQNFSVLQKLKSDGHDKTYSSAIHTQTRHDKKNSADFKDFQKSSSKNNIKHTEVINSQNVCMETENKTEELSLRGQGEQNVSGTQVIQLLPFDVLTEVVISYVSDCGEYWVQKLSDVCRITDITLCLAAEIINAEPLEVPKQKSKCAAKYDDAWFRGRVLSADPLKVHFVDWGNTEVFSSNDNVKLLPEKFCLYPPMACRIRLVDGTPDEYLRKTENDRLKVKPLSKASDGAFVVEVEVVKEASRKSPEAVCDKIVLDPAHEIQIRDEFCEPKELNVSVDTKYTKEDALIEPKKLTNFFPSEDLEFNKPIQVEICKIEEQSFWVMLESRKEKFSELLYVLQNVAEHSKLLLPTANDLCLAKHENLWSRGFVKNVKTLEVFFFDFGETAECSQSNIKELPEKFCTYPPALVHKLHFVKETPNKYLNKREGDCLTVRPISKHDDGSWLVQVEEIVNDISVEVCKQMDHCEDKNILAHNVYTEVVVFVKQSENENMFYVQPQTMLANLVEMSELLCSSKKTEDFRPDVGTICASLFEDVWCRCSVKSVSHENVTVFYIDYGNTEENVSFKRLKPVPEKYINIPPQAVLVKVVNEDCNEDISLYKKYFVRPISELSDGTPVVRISKDLIQQTEEDVNIMTAAHGQKKSASDERIQLQSICIHPDTIVKISYIYDASSIYVQLTDKNSLDVMDEILQEIGSHCQTAPLMDIQPLVGDLVACKYSIDDNWYRAKVLERQEDKYGVFFVDYGNKALVTLDSIRSLPKKYQNIPAQCIKIGLADCNATELTPAAQKCLHEFTILPLIVDFRNNNLTSVILKTEGGVVVNEKLKDSLIPPWKKALLANEDPTRNKLFFLEDLAYTTLPQEKVVTLKVLMYIPPNVLIMCNINTDLHKYVTTTLVDEISDYCNSLPDQTYNPRPNELCCASIPVVCKESLVTSELDEDTSEHGRKKWYRAFCLKSTVDSSLVSLVDFGIQFHIPHNCIRRFVPDFISTPTMACFCTVEGIPEEPSEKLVEKLKFIIQQKKMYEVLVINKLGLNRYSVCVPYIIDALKTENLI